MWSLSLSQRCTCMTPVVPVLLFQQCPVWGRACKYYPGDDFSIPLLFSEGAASLKSLCYCTDVVFSTPVPHHPGQAAAAQQGDLCQPEPGDKGGPGGGHSWSIPPTTGVLGRWVAGCITHIHSWQFVDEVGKGDPSPTATQGETGDRAPGATKRKGCRSEISPGKTAMGCALCRADSLTAGVASVLEELGQLWKMPKD